MPPYNPKLIEPKWQQKWEEGLVFQTTIDQSRPKYYVLDMFPYPSGAGLHVGHVTGYTATDIIARYQRQKGFNVLHPMGWDSFGLPAEQFAIRTGTHPRITTKDNIETFRQQLRSLGFSYDWSRELATSDPAYYKWTQWIFTLLYQKGLAYEAEVLVNFCPALGTVLANEEVEDGISKEGGYPIERRPLKQWILKITAYADRLIEDLDLLDWPDHLKRLQESWIGRSEGATILFEVPSLSTSIEVFTTRPDTLFGVTYLVLAPEHPYLDQIVAPSEKDKVASYRQAISSKSDLARVELAKEKTGVWTGSYALHPVTRKLLPIWVADYVLGHYGSGALMAVPSHDERDFAFALLHHLPMACVYHPDFSWEGPWRKEDQGAIAAGASYWLGPGTLTRSAYGDLNLNGLSMEEGKERVIAWLEQEKKGSRKIQHKLRDWLFSRQRYWGEPFPILHLADGTKRLLTVDELPLEPPFLEDFKPAPTGESPLAKVMDWVHVVDPKTGQRARRETNTMPQWAGSCWYYLRFCDPHNETSAWGLDEERYWMPVDLYVGGVEHAVLHLLYARFWHKVLYDCGFVHTKEPFLKLRNQGLVTARSFKLPQGGYLAPEEVQEKEGGVFSLQGERLIVQTEKMSKSKLNGVSPNEIIEAFGADSLRLYAAFMGPFDKEKVWNTDAVSGCRRFLQRIFDLAHSDKLAEVESEEAFCLIHRLIDKVTKDIETMQFNTAIAAMMETLNDFVRLTVYPKECVCAFIQLLSPFAPHLAEELWHHLGQEGFVGISTWPKANPLYLIEHEVTYVIQVNGKLRSRLVMPKGLSQDKLLARVRQEPFWDTHVKKEPTKIIFVPDRLLNLVVTLS
jgi:leucyl-tRNA synthetase